MIVAGIYIIKSPSRNVYIGQSIDIIKRWAGHKGVKHLKQTSLVRRSFEKYGIAAHSFSILHQLPNDIDSETMTRYEQLYMDQFRECGFQLLNICPAAGSSLGTKHSEEIREKIRNAVKGKPRPPCSESTKAKISEANKGNKATFGKRYSAEVRKKYSLAKIGNTGRTGQKNSEDHKRKISEANKGGKGRTGMPHSDETKEKLRQKRIGFKYSEESKRKMSESQRLRFNKNKTSAK